MASLRTLFLGVYASNAAIRLMFLPICYVLLLSPFLTLAGYYLGFGQTFSAYVPEDFSWTDLLPQVVLSTVFLLLPTRLLSASGVASKTKDGGKRLVQSLPYWIPGFRHFWSIISGGEIWLNGVRESAIDSIVAYNAFGAKHNIILNDTLAEGSCLSQLSQKQVDLQVPRTVQWTILRNAFGIPSTVEAQYFDKESEIDNTITINIYKEIQPLLSSTLHLLSESLPDFVTFNSSIVDQMQWERVADVELTDGTSEAECSLFTLINEFCCNAILPPIIGAQFTEAYQLLATDLATFNTRYWAMALGLPRLTPLQGLPGAALSQKRLLQNLRRMFGELSSPPVKRVPDDDESVSGEETDADVLTPVTKLNDLFKQHDLPLDARASIMLQVLHEIIAEVVPLVFWSLLHIHASGSEVEQDTPVEKIRQETKVWAQALQPPSIHPLFPSPPAIVFEKVLEKIRGSTNALLSSCINETRRLYTCSTTTYKLESPITLTDPSIPNEEWELEANTYIDIGLSQSLLNSSASIFPDPKVYKPDRFTTLPCPIALNTTSGPFIQALTATILTGIIQLWNLTPAPKKSFFDHMQEARAEAKAGAAALTGEQKAAQSSQAKDKTGQDGKAKWVIPRAVDGASVKVPRGDVRVRIRRREGLPAGRGDVRRF
ncbi:hypothetical protein BDU57DRAFT_270051 [Ampelomyces quisqualis]|uniref:Cytochrome P450 n=1 Tax=Ampelomyces quisqualis TaxID=50730 RepID=A0A6A5QKY6_AMPQU|nr:hypothetical protein BDU57DRAFT_270051 [Ampelomyces quisqualis]